ncbi:hypothetical protein C4E04_09365 [Microvirga sp. 17 mud 1-3]|nr:hypothetical protein C4E04_09365 [Microvirga sp. 17 mud 1-3]
MRGGEVAHDSDVLRPVSLPLVGRVRVGVSAQDSQNVALTPTSPTLSHRKSGVPDLRLMGAHLRNT